MLSVPPDPSLLPEFVLPYLRFTIGVVGGFLKARLLTGQTLKAAAQTVHQERQVALKYLFLTLPRENRRLEEPTVLRNRTTDEGSAAKAYAADLTTGPDRGKIRA